jgi:hypothetical protein
MEEVEQHNPKFSNKPLAKWVRILSLSDDQPPFFPKEVYSSNIQIQHTQKDGSYFEDQPVLQGYH